MMGEFGAILLACLRQEARKKNNPVILLQRKIQPTAIDTNGLSG
jgi:hypothetical protein